MAGKAVSFSFTDVFSLINRDCKGNRIAEELFIQRISRGDEGKENEKSVQLFLHFLFPFTAILSSINSCNERYRKCKGEGRIKEEM